MNSSTIKVYRNGEAGDYSGPRKTDGIVSYMRKWVFFIFIPPFNRYTSLKTSSLPFFRQSLPAVSDVTAANHDEFKAADKLVLIAYLDASDDASKALFADFANVHRDDYLFGVSTDSAAKAGVTVPSVVLYKTFDEGRNDFTGPLSTAALATFAKENSVPLLDEISPDNFAMYSEAGLPLAYIFVEASDPKRNDITKAIEPIAREYKGKINFVWIDATKVSFCSYFLILSFTHVSLSSFFPSSPTTENLSTSSNLSGLHSLSKTFKPLLNSLSINTNLLITIPFKPSSLSSWPVTSTLQSNLRKSLPFKMNPFSF